MNQPQQLRVVLVILGGRGLQASFLGTRASGQTEEQKHKAQGP